MMKTKRKFEVDVLVALFLTKEIEAEDEDEANKIAEESVDTSEVMNAFQSGDCEIESQGCTELEEDSE